MSWLYVIPYKSLGEKYDLFFLKEKIKIYIFGRKPWIPSNFSLSLSIGHPHGKYLIKVRTENIFHDAISVADLVLAKFRIQGSVLPSDRKYSKYY